MMLDLDADHFGVEASVNVELRLFLEVGREELFGVLGRVGRMFAW